MNKIRIPKGITLIALIITIVVLLVLAVTAIGAVKDGGIIARSQRTATEYELGKEEEGVKLAINEAKIVLLGKSLTGQALTDGLRSQKLEPDRELSETAPFIFKIEEGTGKEYVIMEDGSIEEIKTDAKEWKYNILSDGTISITKCNLTDLNNIIIPKYLIDENGNKLIVTSLGDNNFSWYSQGNSTLHIADFKGTLILPNDVTIQRYAFYDCPNIEKIVFGENNVTVMDNGGAHQFTSNSTKLKEVKIGKGSQIIYYTFSNCPNIEKVIVEDETIIKSTGFINCTINNIEIKDNVTVEERAFWNTKNEIQKITIGNNFTSLGRWLEGCTIKDITIGDNASLGSHGLMAKEYVTITGTVTINRIVKNLGNWSFNRCTIKAHNDCLEIAEGVSLGNGSLTGIKGIEKIKLGKNVIMKYDGNYICISSAEDIKLECDGPITIQGGVIGGKIILPEKLELLGDSIISNPFPYLTSGYNSTLKEVILNPGAQITSFGNNFPTNIKITLKNISEWDSELLASNKTAIESYGTTSYGTIKYVYEEKDGNGTYTINK